MSSRRDGNVAISIRSGFGAALTLAAIAAGQPAHADNPVPALLGAWSGNGQIRLEGGQTESIKCKAYYTSKSGGAGMSLAIRCASASSSKIEMRATLEFSGNSASGSWEERTYNAAGAVSGTATGGKIALAISGGVTGSMNVTYGGSSHNVSISTSGIALKGVNIVLARG